MGELDLDLGAVTLPAGTTPVDASVGIGSLVITVPEDVALEIDAQAGVGEVNVLGERDDGVDAHRTLSFAGSTPNAPVLERRGGRRYRQHRSAARLSSTPYRLPLALPRLRRAESEGALAGVCAGIAKSLRVDATLVRLTFALLAFAGGAGIAAYGGAWLALAPESGPPAVASQAAARLRRPRDRGRDRAPRLRVLRLADLAGRPLRSRDPAGPWPHRCSGSWSASRSRPIGVIVFVDQNATSNGRDSIFESSTVAIALLLVLGPWAWRLAAERDAERTARIRTEERAEMAARVHDSVLQTLALVQRESGDPRRVAALARRQERELRSWLYPDPRSGRRRRARRQRWTPPPPRSRSSTASRSSSSARATCPSTIESRRSSSPPARR